MTDHGPEARKLATLIDTLLPGTTDFPAASETAAATILARRHRAKAVLLLLQELPDGFAGSSEEKATSMLEMIEQQRPDLFRDVIEAVYAAYYSDPSVLAAIARTTGYQHPPQPAGYAMPAFDETILNHVRTNPESWRDTRM